MTTELKIETPRLILRTPRLEDAVEINRAMNEVWRDLQLWMSWAHEGENTLEATQRYIVGSKDRILIGDVPLIGFDKASGEFTISTGLHIKGDSIYETGYWVAKNHLGKGFATESTNAVIRYAFNVLGAKEMRINYFEGNEKSSRVIEKLGFTFKETKTKVYKRCLDGVLLDSHDFVMTDPSALPPIDVRW